MKKLIIASFALLLSASTLFAQQIPMFSSYNTNKVLLTPSATGMEGMINFNLNGRLQFAGFAGAPKTSVLTMEYGEEGKNFGAGLVLYADKLGVTNNNGIQANYAYRIPLTKDLELGLGVAGAFDFWRFDNHLLSPQDFTDPGLMNNFQKATSFRGDIGAHLKTDRLFFSLTVPKAFSNNLNYVNELANVSNDLAQLTHIQAYASYKLDLGESGDYALTPGALVRIANGVAPQFDANLIFDYKDIAYLTGAYRQGYAGSLGFGIHLTDRSRIGYSYDFPINSIKTYGTGSHEMIIGYKLTKRPLNRGIEIED